MLAPPSIDHAEQNAQSWLRAIAQQLDCDDLRIAESGLRAVLHVIRDRLPLPEVVALGAQLPLLIRGIYYDGWRPQAVPPPARHVEEFLGLVERELQQDAQPGLQPQHVVDAVVEELRARIAPCDLASILPALPPGLHLLLFTSTACRPHAPPGAAPAVHSSVR